MLTSRGDLEINKIKVIIASDLPHVLQLSLKDRDITSLVSLTTRDMLKLDTGISHFTMTWLSALHLQALL